MMKAFPPYLAAASALTAGLALAQQPAPPPPAFAPSDLTPAGVRALAANCAACHGTDGKPASGSMLGSLAGKPAGELRNAMIQFKEGKRPATVMHQLTKGYSNEEIGALAEYFSKQPR